MSSRIRKLSFLLVSPMLSVGLLAGIVAEHRHYLKPQDFEPYHIAAKSAIESLPYSIPPFSGADNDDVPKAAQILLKPNIILSRRYTDISVASLFHPRSANVLIVQCKQSGDMVGHFPPICYPSHGWENMCPDKTNKGWLRDWIVDNQRICGKEYQFSQTENGQTKLCTVYNFIVVPGRGIVRDIQGVEQAAEDYQQRYYGAAQFQVVFQEGSSDPMTREQRDEIFTTLMTPAVPIIRQLDTTLKTLKDSK